MNNNEMAFWLSWCIEEYAAEHKISDTETAALFSECGILAYLEQNAEILHTQGRNYILDCIQQYIHNKKDCR